MRVFVRILASLLGLVIAAVGLALTVETAWAWAFPEKAYLLMPWPQWRTVLSGQDWNQLPVQLIAAVAVVVGLLLLSFALAARRREVRLHEPAADVTVSTSPRSLARVVGSRVRQEDGVSSAAVIATARRIRVRADSRLQAEKELRPKILDAVKDAIDTLPLPRQPRISVVVHSTKEIPS